MHICYHCIDYKTDSLSDMIRHFKRKKNCNSSTLYEYEHCKELSKRKYTFTFNTTSLSKDDYIYIITHYYEKNNIIHENFRSKINEVISNNILSQFMKNNDCESMSDNESDSNDDIINFICNKCNTIFSNKSNLKRHLENEKACERKQHENFIFNKNKIQNSIIQQKEMMNQNITNTYVDNSKNINIQNNNNNSNNNVYHFQIKDFIHDRYDISHIKDDFYAKKDFFLYHNFLRLIMENKKNHNIFFSNNEAIVYTDNELCKMTSDKAGYLILDKLNQSFHQLLHKQEPETKNYYGFISTYYRIILGHYKHDTIHKDYDVDERQFVYTAHSNMFRSRDKYLMKMISTLEKCKNSARENMFITLDEIKNIPMMNPNIEDYASIRMRYRDLKD